MIIVEGYVKFADAGDFARVRDAAFAQMSASRAEPGCLEYTYAMDVADPCLMRVLERWESWPALEAHFAQAHMLPWRAALAAVTVVERNLHAHEVSLSRKV
ncbi:antibiotic biosynthesis monooxygenase domain protein [Hyphomonas neptunium ATCC 15444]|uniref:Antibiotic biosynthesis monooxygenase domain protein n=2 Tax=Hyphomonas TaxID=85 RepID=Q0BXA1_HYPNA|nr:MULTISPECIES: putative quinol monooxygenase [Hyphomonas]ABI77258.1 antibiotic biosynthesis monooxygenase domain protein [Hyphomonas neptunium ATCC 15444]KCZ86913.1 antibiotic biosynthesis monooxygenase domain-containing protein [Hyphomonas hirschiana VP5]